MNSFKIWILVIGICLGFGVLVLGFIASGCSASSVTSTKIDDLNLSVSMRPDPPRTGSNSLIIVITDSKNKTIDGASISVTYIMPAMPQMGMPEMRGKSQADFKNGNYEAKVDLSMSGNWIVRLDISGVNGKTGYVEYSLITGSKGLSLNESSFSKSGEMAESDGSTDGIRISSEKQQLIGIKIEPAKREGLAKTIKTVGAVAFDPDLYSAQTEYSQAVLALEKAEESGDQGIINNAKELIAAAELKLEFLGISRGMISKIMKSDDSLLVGSKNGSVWVYAKIYENELSLVKEGMTVHVTSKNLPGEMFMGKIASIDPVIDQMTRSVRVRALVQNKKGMLKPNMFLIASIEIPLSAKIVIPEDAVMDTGENQIVYVEKKKGVFEKRDVSVGQRSKGMIEILSGLKEGERVVTSGTFLIDSESKLKSTGGGHQH